MSAIAFDFDEERRAFHVVVDAGTDRWMPMLSPADFTGWHARHARVYAELQRNAASSQTLVDWIRTERLAEQQLVDAVLAYDRTGVLGTRAAFEDTFTVEQVIVMARRIARAHG
jgi:hypothetical protein